jgi:serine/threonine-protein kinase
MKSFHLLGPIYLGEATHAFLGLEISSDHQIEPVVVVWLPGNSHGDILEQMKQEALAATALKHPNVLRLHGLYELDGRLARIVDYVDGEPLQRFLEVEKSLPVPFAARIVCDAAEGVHYVHGATSPPWVHSALRPETLMLSFSGLSRVSGYGAQVFASTRPLDPRFRGRRRHIAPEQIVGGNDATSPQTDVYLLGLCLYECITGMIPFIAETNFDEAVLTRPLPPMPPETPSALESVIAKACAKKAADRYASAWELRQAIISAVGILPSHEELADALNAWIPPTEKSRAHRQQLMDEGLSQVLSQLPSGLKDDPENWVPSTTTECLVGQDPPPLPGAAKHPPIRHGEFEISPDAMTLPPFSRGPPGEAPPAAGAPIFVSPKASAHSPPHDVDDDEEEIESKLPSSAVAWAAGGFIAAAAIAVIAYFTLLPSPPPPPEPAKTTAPVAAIPPPTPTPPPIELPPAPTPKAATKTKSAKTAAKTKSTAAAEAPAPNVEPVRVNVQADMPLDISFKGRHLGKTPAQVSLPSGKVTLVLSNKSAGIRTRRHLELSPGKTAVDLNIQLGKGTLNVNAPPGAQIRINGVLKGTAPLGDIELWEGDHRLSIRHNDQTLSDSFSLVPGGYMNYDITESR